MLSKSLVFSAIRLARGLPCFGYDDREADMEIATRWAVLVVATVIAGGAAFAMAGALLSGALRLMQPAGRPAGQPLAGTGRGARLLARG